MHPTLPHTNVRTEGEKKVPTLKLNTTVKNGHQNPATDHENRVTEDTTHIPREDHTKKKDTSGVLTRFSKATFLTKNFTRQ